MINMETLYLTKAEYRERFDAEFRHLSRSLKEMGCYKFILNYIFSHHHKTKDDLFETYLNDRYEGHIHIPSLIEVMGYKTTLGYKRNEFATFDDGYWTNNISHIHHTLKQFYAEGFINKGKHIIITD
jgi:hypothetical protein